MGNAATAKKGDPAENGRLTVIFWFILVEKCLSCLNLAANLNIAVLLNYLTFCTFPLYFSIKYMHSNVCGS